MRNSFYFFIALCFACCARAQDTTKILFIGNSFTFFNNMPQMVQSLADSAHLPVLIGMHTPGGVSVGDIAQGSMAHMNNPALFSLIRSRKWDFAVLQDNQGRFIRDSAVFSPASLVVQGHLNIMDSVKANNSCAKMILFGGWAFKNGSPPYGNTGIELIKRILVNYRVLNDTMKEVIAPIGEAWTRAINYLPAVNLWDADDAHPSYAGSYLTASVIFSTIFNLPAKTLDYSAGLSSATSGKLRAFADSAVFDAAGRTIYNLGGAKKIAPQQQSGQLIVPGGFAGYQWYMDGLPAGNQPAQNLAGNGDYWALLRESDGCLIKTCMYRERNNVFTGISPDKLPEALEVYPNPVMDGRMRIRYNGMVPLYGITLVNMTGLAEKITIETLNGETHLLTTGLKPGCYILIVATPGGKLHKKITVVE